MSTVLRPVCEPRQPMHDLFSPKQVAQALGVSESSLKRWCDQGWIETVKTPGGHRRMTAAGVMSFLRRRNEPLVRPELLGLPSNTGKTDRMLDRAARQFQEALADGDEEVCRTLILDLFLSKHRLAQVLDLVFAPAYWRLGDRWERGGLEIYQERRAVQMGLRVLAEVRRLLAPTSDERRRAIGGTWEGDPYLLPTALVELTLLASGWCATNLGPSLPFSTLEAALVQARPRLFWLSVSHVGDQDVFVEQYSRFFEQAEVRQAAVAVGGQGLTEPLRRRIRYTTYCANMRELESFAATLDPINTSQTGEACSP
ncbi:MAG: helix-turn-helix domain-containing protein [Thermoguttaceae bacterium]